MGFSALDYAIIHGNYKSAVFLYSFDKELRNEWEYE